MDFVGWEFTRLEPWMDLHLFCFLSAMLSEWQGRSMLVRTPAKVNLFLEVLGKRPDGYHEINTLMAAVGLFDTLEFTEEAGDLVTLQCDHANLSTGPDNLICRAARLLKERTHCTKGASIHLIKRIPMAAGLAGGSSDAAATLSGLNRLWRLGLTSTQLATLGAELGSDIPFFFSLPMAWCTGRGEKVELCPLVKPFYLVLVNLPVGLSTADVYRNVAVPAQPHSGSAMRQALAAGDMEAIGRELHNHLQPAAEKLCEAIGTWLARLERLRPAGQLMSGSGTALFALCRDRNEAQRVARALGAGQPEDSGTRVRIVRSCY